MSDLVSKIESLLFVSSKPVSAKTLAKFIGDTTENEVEQSLAALIQSKESGGVVILKSNGVYQMATSAANTDLVKRFLNSDLREALTEATIEVLAIIAYRQPISKAEIESIRGVNSQYSIRALLMRGLIEKISHPHDARGHLFQTSTEFLQHLGINSIDNLPEFETLTTKIVLEETKVEAQSENVANDSISTELVNENLTDNVLDKEAAIDNFDDKINDIA